MSPKKKKKSAEKQKESQRKTTSESPGDKRVFDGRERDFYRTQLGFLTEELDRVQLRCSDLQQQNRTFLSESSRLQQEQQDIVEYLKHSLVEKEQQLETLSEQLQSQRRVADQNRDVLLLQQAQLKAEVQQQMDELVEEKKTLEQKVGDLQEFHTQEEELRSNMEELKKQLQHQEEKHKEELHNLEMKVLMERSRSEEEAELQAAAQVQILVEEKLPEASRLVLQENLEVKAYIRQLSEQKKVLMEENAALREQRSQLSVDLEILEQTVRQTSRTSCIRRKELQQLQNQLCRVLAENEELRQNRASQSEQCNRIRAQTGQLEAELKEEQRRSSRMKSVLQEAAVGVRRALMEEPADQDHWKQLLQNLLVLLDGQTELQVFDPGTARTQNPDLLRTWFQQNHCRSGGTRVLSHPTPKTQSALCRTGAGPNRTVVPLHRKPAGQKPAGSEKQSAGFLTSKHLFNKLDRF